MENKSAWIFKPKEDFLFLFSIPLISLFFLFSNNILLLQINGILLTTMNLFLSGGHGLGPILYFAFNRAEQERIKKFNKAVNIFLILSMSLPVIIMICSIYFYAIGDHKTKGILFLIMGFFYLIWNTYHFTQQQFGILAILKSKINIYTKYQRWFDLLICHLFLSIIPMLIWYSIGIRFEALSLFDIPTKKLTNILPNSEFIFSTLYLIFFAFVIYTIFKKKFSLPIHLQYFSILIQSVGMMIHPIFFTLVIFGSTHRLQEIYFVAKIADKDLNISFKKILKYLILISLTMYFIFESQAFQNNKVSNFGSYRGMENLSLLWYAFFSIGNGLLIGINFGHFYIDSYIYKNRSWKSTSLVTQGAL